MNKITRIRAQYRVAMVQNETVDVAITWPEIGANLRKIRLVKGLTLKDVEQKSKGKWKAVVIGSYERSHRALTIKKAIALADFYQVPLGHLLGITQNIKTNDPTRIRLDLRKVAKGANTSQIKLFAAWITGSRQDWNGEILSIRHTDLLPLAITLNLAESEVLTMLDNANLIYKEIKK
jgi:transcriptional regulator with XRE-family HTH domain